MRREIEHAQAAADQRVAAAEQAVQDARGEARTQILAAQQQAADAGNAHTRAEADRAAAERRATEDRATLQRVRAELEQLRTDHHTELVELRREAADERAALRREAGQQLAAVLTRFDTPTPPPPQKDRRVPGRRDRPGWHDRRPAHRIGLATLPGWGTSRDAAGARHPEHTTSGTSPTPPSHRPGPTRATPTPRRSPTRAARSAAPHDDRPAHRGGRRPHRCRVGAASHRPPPPSDPGI